MPITPQEALQRVLVHREIFFDEMVDLMRQIMRGEVSPVMTAALLTGLRVKKETIGEIAAAASVMREFAAKVEVPDNSHFVDIVGTGGDGAHTFNISTAAMFVCAAAGAKVAKHGNRSVSSKSGSADVLESLGAVIELQPDAVAKCLAQTGFGFMFAPIHHPAMRHVAPVRRELGVRTIFNILGPLTNPAGAPNILMGVFHADLVGIQARVLQRLGTSRALVVHGRDGLDEITLAGGTMVAELRDGKIEEYELLPGEYGFAMNDLQSIRVESPAESRAMLPFIEVLQLGRALHELRNLDFGILAAAAFGWGHGHHVGYERQNIARRRHARPTVGTGWPVRRVPPGQRPEFEEITLVLEGYLRVEYEGGILDVKAGQTVVTAPGEWIRYSTPEGAEYVAICLPAFSPDTVHRDDE